MQRFRPASSQLAKHVVHRSRASSGRSPIFTGRLLRQFVHLWLAAGLGHLRNGALTVSNARKLSIVRSGTRFRGGIVPRACYGRTVGFLVHRCAYERLIVDALEGRSFPRVAERQNSRPEWAAAGAQRRTLGSILPLLRTGRSSRRSPRRGSAHCCRRERPQRTTAIHQKRHRRRRTARPKAALADFEMRAQDC